MLGIMIDVETLLILGIPILIFLIATRMVVKKKKRKSLNLIKELTIFILGIYILLLIGVTLFPINIMLGDEPIRESLITLNPNYSPNYFLDGKISKYMVWCLFLKRIFILA